MGDRTPKPHGLVATRRAKGLARRLRALVGRAIPRRALTLERYLRQAPPHEALLRRLYPDGARVVFDVGACEGEDSIRYSRMFPEARVFACEALPTNLVRLRENLERFGADRVVVVPYAISDRRGAAPFHVSSGRPPNARDDEWDFGNKSSSLLLPDMTEVVHGWLRFDETIEVETRTLADVLDEHRLERIDFLHLDVQGAELMALHGAGDRLGSIGSIWLEVEAIPLYRNQPLGADIEGFMAANGFTKVLDTVDEVSGDRLYVNTAAFDVAAFQRTA